MMPHVAIDSAEGVRWDLTRVFADGDAARRALADLDEAAAALETPGEDVADIRAALDAHDDVVRVAEALHEEWGYAALRLSADLGDVEGRDLVTAAGPVLERVRAACRRLEERYGELTDETLAHPLLAPYRYYLARRRLERKYRLTPLAEQAFAARGDAANAAWRRLYDDTMTAVSVPFDAGGGPEPHTLEALGALLHHEDREIRLRSVAAARAAREAVAETAAACLDAVIGDRLAEDRLRGHDHPMGATLFTDQVTLADVEALLTAIEGRASIVRRWYERKAGLLGIAECTEADRVAPVGTPRDVPWNEAVTLAHDVFAALGDEPGALARELSASGLIDAEPRVGKSAGIYCAPLPQGFPSLIQLTYRGAPRDAFTLAHELGHSVHFELAKAAHPWLSVERSMSMAVIEIPSTTAEIAAVDRAIAGSAPDDRGPLLRGFAESMFDLVFEAAALCRFEQDAAALRAGGVSLTADRLAGLWRARVEPYFGAATAPDGWIQWPHPYGARFYNYQYSFAFLCSFGLASLRRADPYAFGPRYTEMLRAGGSLPPAELLAIGGLDLSDPALWETGLDEIERLCDGAW
jgi:oligoendopeptidase F